jgi:3-hydroxyisobutyrate dehydrogenase-like beta-hydroxyacid dehydrogenase
VGGLGAGHAAKIVNNAAMGGVWQAMIESFRLGARLGLDFETMLRIMEREPRHRARLPRPHPEDAGRRSDGGLPRRGRRQGPDPVPCDGRAAGEPLPALEAARENFRAVAEAGHAEDDLAVAIPVRTAAP